MLKVTIKTTRHKAGRFVDKINVPIKCPYCGHETTETLARLQDDPILICSACSKGFQFESGGTARETADEINKLDRALDNLFK